MNGRRYAIPDRLNALLTIVACALLAGLLAWLAIAQRTESIVFATVLFALVFQTNFALFHEAGHHKLHSNPRLNAFLGTICGIWFGMSFSMFAVSHTAHHLKNRTDDELFDLVRDGESPLQKSIVWYGMLLGIWYWTIPFANLLLLAAPGVYRSIAERWQITNDLFRDPRLITRIRIELLFVLCAPIAFLLLGVPPLRLLLAYASSAFLWSTTQYLEHAYAPRAVIDGAFNLRAPRVYSWLNLHRELDLNHHRHPHEAWLHLPRLSDAKEPRRSYVRHYFSQWRGVRRTGEPSPAPLALEDVL